MENARIIKLSPPQNSGEVVTFEQAFGEHSEARGKRTARKAARSAKKAQNKKTKGNRLGRAALAVATGGLVGGVIKTGPQARADRQAKKLERIERRGVRKAAKQVGRAAQQEARQTRKDVRKTRKVARKELQPIEAEEPETDQAEYQEPEAEYTEPEAEYEEPVEEEEYVEEEEAPEEEEYEEEEEEAPEEEYAEDQEYFSGELAASAEGMPEIHSEIRGITEKIVWNREAARRQGMQKNKLVSDTKSLLKDGRNKRDVSRNSSVIQGCDVIIQKHEARIKELEDGLKKYGAHPHIGEGYRQAETKLQKTKEGVSDREDKAKVKSTLIQPGIDANVSNQRIDIPARNGNKMTEVEITSGLSGPVMSGLSTQTKWLLAIAAVGVGVVLAKKYKYI